MIGTNLWYLVGSFSQEDLSLETAPCPNPEMMANIELKFCVSLHCLAILINCLIILILLVELFSLTISPIAHIISLLTSSANRPKTSSSHVFNESWIYETWFFPHEICRLFLSVLNRFSFKNQTRLQNANTAGFFNRKDTSFSKKQFQTENSGFVKTCDEHVLREGVPYLDFSNSYKSSTYSVASIWRKMVKSSTISWVETSTGFKFSKLTKDSLTKDRILCLNFLLFL